jgi:hypothetical protein
VTSLRIKQTRVCRAFVFITVLTIGVVSVAGQTVTTFLGRVTDDTTGQPVQNAAIVAIGNQTGSRLAISDAQGNYAIELPANTNIKIRAYKTRYIFNPALAGFSSLGGLPIMGQHPMNFSGTALPFPILIFSQAPILLTEDNSLNALIADNMFRTREPFQATNAHYLGPDKRTRLTLLLVDLELFTNEILTNTISVQGRDDQQNNFAFAVEDLRKVPDLPWLSQLVVRVPGELSGPRSLNLTVTARGQVSNVGRVLIQ